MATTSSVVTRLCVKHSRGGLEPGCPEGEVGVTDKLRPDDGCLVAVFDLHCVHPREIRENRGGPGFRDNLGQTAAKDSFEGEGEEAHHDVSPYPGFHKKVVYRSQIEIGLHLSEGMLHHPEPFDSPQKIWQHIFK